MHGEWYVGVGVSVGVGVGAYVLVHLCVHGAREQLRKNWKIKEKNE